MIEYGLAFQSASLYKTMPIAERSGSSKVGRVAYLIKWFSHPVLSYHSYASNIVLRLLLIGLSPSSSGTISPTLNDKSSNPWLKSLSFVSSCIIWNYDFSNASNSFISVVCCLIISSLVTVLRLCLWFLFCASSLFAVSYALASFFLFIFNS